jgi:hypothetical protein
MTVEELLDIQPYDPGAVRTQLHPTTIPPNPNDPLAIAGFGISLRESGAYEEAETIFVSLIDRFPRHVFGYQQLGLLRSRLGRHEEAVRLFRHALVVDPSDMLTIKYLIFELIRIGDFDGALKTIHDSKTEPKEANYVFSILREFVNFTSEYTAVAALDLVKRFERTAHYLPPSKVGELIRAAAESREPFSLIRLGDGEGAWLPSDEKDESRFGLLHEIGRRSILKVWFASDALYNVRSFVALGRQLLEIVQRTDVVGVPSGLRLAHEYRVVSIRGVPANVNILRSLSVRLDSPAPGTYCGQDIHLDLLISGFFRELLSMPFTFGVISCHPDLGYRLIKSFGSRVVRVIVVPEEKSFSQIAGISGISAPHYPQIFQRVVERLQRESRQVTIWLIAAGYLGKFYCDRVRENGGIALDIGSIADGWSGKNTRPTFKMMEQLRN